MADAPNGNGYKSIALAFAIGAVGSGGSTYFVATDYNRDITNLRIEAARNECRIDHLLERLEAR